MVRVAMAKAPKKKSGPKPKVSGVRLSLITMRCTPEFKARLEALAKKEDRTPSVVIERALRAYVEAVEGEPFPER